MNWWLVAVGLFVHLIFFYSIFDIYFTSPLVHGMTPHSTPMPAPARRLILFVADGLRADKVFELDKQGKSRAPHIRNVMEQRGVWGVSHTHVPTESRPGHVALIAGFYEDVSAVAKGWKENPVEFDSVFNESRYTWSWGSPDILPMFSKGATGDHVFMEMYPAESEDFAGADSSKLDTWVFDQVKSFLDEARTNATLGDMLRQDKVVLFMHLLGLDTNGHAHRPYSEEYLENIQIVDNGIQNLEIMIEEFFGNDGRTAYVMSADHGMTNWGSHGAGHPSETLTPLVTWGAGVRKPLPPDPASVFEDNFQQEWKLTNFKRSDVNQADIAPLMASLVGLSFPLNSVGVLPVDYLGGEDKFKAQSLFTNAHQILEQFEIKMAQKKQTTLSFLFTPYKLLTPARKVALTKYISLQIYDGKYEEAIVKTKQLIELALQGLNYYHNYDRFFLGTSIAFGFLAWMSYLVTVIFEKHTNLVRIRSRFETTLVAFWKSEKGIRLVFSLLGSLIILLLYVQSLPWTYYLYCLLPVILGHKVTQRLDILRTVYHYTVDSGYLWSAIYMVVLGILGLEIIVLSFFYRELLSLGLFAMALWPLFTSLRTTDMVLVLSWSLACLVLAVFPLLPVVGRSANYNLVCLAGWLALMAGLYCVRRPESGILTSTKLLKDDHMSRQVRIITIVEVLLLCLSIYIVRSTAASISDKEGLPLLNQLLSWCILAASFVLPVMSATKVYTRLLNLTLAFFAPYLLLSTSHEGLFCLVLCVVMFLWVQLEHRLVARRTLKIHELDFVDSNIIGESQRHLMLSDPRCAYFFIFFLLTAFFGTGNIASINSFDPASVYCFLTVFNPFVMGTLMMWKNLIPFMLVTCAFNAIHVTVNVPTQSLFLLVLLMSDFMGLHFFFLVRDYGSWLDIGTSISHYVIVMCMICFLIILLAVGKVFTTCTLKLRPLAKQHPQ